MFNIRFIAFALVFLSSVGFLNPKGVLSDQMVRAGFYGLSVLAMMVAFASGRKLRGVDYPRIPYWTIIVSIVFSAFMASAFHPQGLKVSLMVALSPLMSYLFFWTLMKLDVPEKDVLRFLLVCCLIAVPVYFLNVLTWPNYLFGKSAEQSMESLNLTRGIIRVPIFFFNFMVVFIFLGIDKCLKRWNWKWAVLVVLFSMMVVLSVTRQYILITAVLSFIFVFTNVNLAKKIILIIVALGMGTVALKSTIGKALTEVSEDQAEDNEVEDEDIRVYDYRYFGNEAQTNMFTRIFGNGAPSFGNSPWGNQMDSEWDTTGTFYVDVGWVGFYWLYGALATLALLCLFVMSAIVAYRSKRRYLTYAMIYIIFVSIASGPIIYQNQIIEIMIMLYLVYGIKNNETNEENGSDHTKLQQRRRLGQLRRERIEV